MVGLFRRAAAAPRKVSRATRRLTHAAGLTANIAACMRRLELLDAKGLDADGERLSFLQWLAGNVCAIHGIEVELLGADVLARTIETPAIVVANHISYVDPLAILARVPAFSIAKKEVAQWPFLGQVATQLGMIPYRRGDPFDGAQVLRRCEHVLRRGHRLLAFPEGTTTHGNDVAAFHRGVFFLAKRCGVPVVPVALRYSTQGAAWVGDQTFLPHYVKTTMRSVTRVSLQVCSGISPGRFASARALADRTRAVIASAVRG